MFYYWGCTFIIYSIKYVNTIIFYIIIWFIFRYIACFMNETISLFVRIFSVICFRRNNPNFLVCQVYSIFLLSMIKPDKIIRKIHVRLKFLNAVITLLKSISYNLCDSSTKIQSYSNIFSKLQSLAEITSMLVIFHQ